MDLNREEAYMKFRKKYFNLIYKLFLPTLKLLYKGSQILCSKKIVEVAIFFNAKF
jgi:hypothetical protein